jgi:hypothetical protein
MRTHALCLGVALTLLPVVAMAGGQADLRVGGKIAPSSCEVRVRNGTLDLGQIHLSDLNPDQTQPTHLVDKENELDILCTGPARFAIGASDLASGGGNGRESFGLGQGINGKSIGYIVISERHDGFNADGTRAYLTASEDLETWTASSIGAMPFLQAGYVLGLNKTEGSTSGPAFVSAATFWLHIGVYIAPRVDLVMEDQLALAGNVSFEITYF